MDRTREAVEWAAVEERAEGEGDGSTSSLFRAGSGLWLSLSGDPLACHRCLANFVIVAIIHPSSSALGRWSSSTRIVHGSSPSKMPFVKDLLGTCSGGMGHAVHIFGGTKGFPLDPPPLEVAFPSEPVDGALAFPLRLPRLVAGAGGWLFACRLIRCATSKLAARFSERS